MTKALSFCHRVCAGLFTAIHFHTLRFWRHWVTVWATVFAALIIGWMFVQAPITFQPTTITVTAGESALEIARDLADAHVIRTPYPLWTILRVSGGDGQIRAGTYQFENRTNVFHVARRLVAADYGIPMVKLTFVEGVTSREIADQVSRAFPGVSRDAVLALAKPQEGYLFPDTYFFPPSTDVEAIIETMRKNFDRRFKELERDLARSGHTLREVVTMASLLEKETRTDESRELVSGILWNRLERDMPLQVDAVFGYIFNRPTYSPSPTDLKVDSPYNTYANRGLPPGPINNPGLDALRAALNPASTKNLYYLTGNDGEMYYATTYEGHKANLQKYLQ